jgi:hypothetical protein
MRLTIKSAWSRMRRHDRRCGNGTRWPTLSLPTPLPALVTAWVRAIETARYEMAFSISLLVSQATGECIGKTQNRMSDKPFVRSEPCWVAQRSSWRSSARPDPRRWSETQTTETITGISRIIALRRRWRLLAYPPIHESVSPEIVRNDPAGC